MKRKQARRDAWQSRWYLSEVSVWLRKRRRFKGGKEKVEDESPQLKLSCLESPSFYTHRAGASLLMDAAERDGEITHLYKKKE